MLRFICIRTFVRNYSLKLQEQNAVSPIIKLFSSKFSGLAREAATNLSCYRKQKNSHAVLALLRNHGFSNAQISKVLKGRPQVVSADPNKTLLPKIEFLSSIGISTTDLPAIISNNPTLLGSSLEKTLVPAYNFLKSVLLSDELVAKSIRRNSRIVFHIVGGPVALNLDVLRGAGVPESRISFLLLRFPYVVCLKHHEFKRCVDDVIKMRFDPLKLIFINAVQVKCEISKPNWDRKLEVYWKWGLSNEEILLAFKKHPICMTLSDKNIMMKMDFFVNKMGWNPAIITKIPTILFYNLEKRIVPRCRVIKVLMSKGLVKRTLDPSTFLHPIEKKFFDRFVSNYKDDLPGVFKLYHGEIGLLESEF